ncbi:hypothetical protein VUR80DRAFT_6784 [Thermomyces stellatus]
MKATLALAMANAMLAAAKPANTCMYATQVDVKTVTAYVYPKSSPATHLSAQPTGDSVNYETISEPATGSSDLPSSSDDSSETEEPTEGSEEGSGSTVPDLGLGGGSGGDSGLGNSADFSSVQEVSLNAHNAHRANHSCDQVEWDSNLAERAQELADSCSYGHDTSIGDGGYGQNIAMGAESNFALTEGQAAARAITRQWYNNEFELYPNYGGEPDWSSFEEWGHLTQILWAKTTKIGCAIALCNNSELASGMEVYFVVCNYEPAGNVNRSFTEKEYPPGYWRHEDPPGLN